MITEVGELVVEKYDGSLKTEHGTGRNMAPYVEYEWGTDAYQIMKELKLILDPENLLNPGVIFNDDPECGFCEVNCVSCGLTLSSRTRIALQREISRLEATGDNPSQLKTLKKQYSYLWCSDLCRGRTMLYVMSDGNQCC